MKSRMRVLCGPIRIRRILFFWWLGDEECACALYKRSVSHSQQAAARQLWQKLTVACECVWQPRDPKCWQLCQFFLCRLGRKRNGHKVLGGWQTGRRPLGGVCKVCSERTAAEIERMGIQQVNPAHPPSSRGENAAHLISTQEAFLEGALTRVCVCVCARTKNSRVESFQRHAGWLSIHPPACHQIVVHSNFEQL